MRILEGVQPFLPHLNIEIFLPKVPFTNYISTILQFFDQPTKGPSINYVVSLGGRGVAPKTIY